MKSLKLSIIVCIVGLYSLMYCEIDQSGNNRMTEKTMKVVLPIAGIKLNSQTKHKLKTWKKLLSPTNAEIGLNDNCRY